MNGQKILAGELAISMAIVVWSAVKKRYWPYPPNAARVAFAYAIIGLFALLNDQFAALLGAGFLMAQVVKTPVDANGQFKFTGGLPAEDAPFYVLSFGEGSLAKNPDVRRGGAAGMKPITDDTGSAPGTTDGKRDGSIPIQA